MRFNVLPLLLGSASLLPGCIAWEIRDEMRLVNTQLADTNPELGRTTGLLVQVDQDIRQTTYQLAQTHALLDKTSRQIAELHALLLKTDQDLLTVGGTLDRTQPKMASLDEQLDRMKVINEVQASLKETNAALVPLSKTLGSVGGMLSLFGSGGGGDLLEAERPASEVATAGGEPAGPGGSIDEAAERRRMLVAGTWIQVYPPPEPPRTSGRVLVLMGDGSYLQADQGQSLISGKWKREGRMATLTPDGAGAAGGAGAQAETFELVSLSGQTLTIRQADSIRVFGRP